jgi:hypothetical protein
MALKRVKVFDGAGSAIVNLRLGECRIERHEATRIDGKDYDTGKPVIILPGTFPVLITEE